MPTTRQEILHTYRALYKTGLLAVRHAKPARYTLRDRLRNAFRTGDLKDYEAQRVARTLDFLDNAARWQGLEHRVLRNLMRVWRARELGYVPPPLRKPEYDAARKDAFAAFDRTIEELNRTMGMCLK